MEPPCLAAESGGRPGGSQRRQRSMQHRHGSTQGIGDWTPAAHPLQKGCGSVCRCAHAHQAGPQRSHPALPQRGRTSTPLSSRHILRSIAEAGQARLRVNVASATPPSPAVPEHLCSHRPGTKDAEIPRGCFAVSVSPTCAPPYSTHAPPITPRFRVRAALLNASKNVGAWNTIAHMTTRSPLLHIVVPEPAGWAP